MTDKFKPTFKQPFIPKTETRIFLGGRPIDQQTKPTISKSVNKQHYQSERIGEINPGYGSCSYSECPHSTDFNLEIFIEGNRRKWAKSTGVATWLPGSWETGFWTSHSAAVGAVFGPGASAAAYLAGEASRVVGVETNASKFLGDVSGNVGNIALDAVDGIVEEFERLYSEFGSYRCGERPVEAFWAF